METNSVIIQQITPEQLREMISEIFTQKISDLQPHQEQTPKYLTRQETADLLHVSLVTLHQWNREGTLKPRRIGNRVLYRLSEIEETLEKIAGYAKE